LSVVVLHAYLFKRAPLMVFL